MAHTLNPMKRHRERCREVRAQMSDYLDSELDASAASGVERHVRWCPNCRRMLENLRRTIGGLRALSEMPTPADDPQG
jgi:anti-sigma factor RsiW